MTDVCTWELADEDWSYWQGDCGVAFTVDGMPEENDMHFCPKCGKRLVAFVKVPADFGDGRAMEDK